MALGGLRLSLVTNQPPQFLQQLVVILYQIVRRIWKRLTRQGALIEEQGESYLPDGEGACLKPAGKVVRANSTSDGPFMEAKEVLGGYSNVQVADIERAVDISKSCPVLMMPGASIEVRELAGY